MNAKSGADIAETAYEQVLQFVQENSKLFVKSVEASEQFPEVSRRTLNKRLNQLCERGALKKTNWGE